MFNTLGSNTATVIYKKNGNEIHHEFVVGTPGNPIANQPAICMGSPVKLTSDGKVIPLEQEDDTETLMMGVALQSRKVGEYITICLRGRMVVQATTTDVSVAAGPVKLEENIQGPSPLQETIFIPRVENNSPAVATEMVGWALNPATTDGVVLLLYKH